MNTLILNGSFNSNSDFIIKTLNNALTGKYKIIDLYSLKSFSDESIDKYVRSCSCIILISPVIFGTVPGRLIDFAIHFMDKSATFVEKYSSIIFTDTVVPDSSVSTAKNLLYFVKICCHTFA